MPDSAPLHSPDPSRIEALHFDPTAEGGVRLFSGPPPDHFAILGLPPRLQLNLEAMREAFLDLSRRLHPDFHSQASPALRDEVLRRSSAINNAYKVLRELPRRADYLIQLLAPGLESNRNAVPPELLEEMFDIQEAGEALREARVNADAEGLARAEQAIVPLRAQVNEARGATDAALEACAGELDTLLAGGPSSDQVLGKLRELRLCLDRQNYLRTVIRNLK